MRVYSPDIPVGSADFINYPQVLEFTLSQFHLPADYAAKLSAAVAIHTVPIFVQPGNHYCWVDSILSNTRSHSIS